MPTKKAFWLCFLMTAFFSMNEGHAQARFSCRDLKAVKSSLDSIKTRKSFNSTNPKVARALEYMTDLFETVLHAKTNKEANAIVSRISNCLISNVTFARLEDARNYVADVKNKEIKFDKEEFSILELVCAGFSVKEVIALSGGSAASAGTGTAIGAAGATAAAVTAAALGGWLLGESLMMLDSQTGNNFKRPFNRYIITPIVNWWVGVPSDQEIIRGQAKLMATRFLVTYQENKFGKLR